MISCSSPTKQTGNNSLEEKANKLYESESYAEAKSLYDTLIAADRANGEYYFKRAYCKSMLSSDDPSVIADYLQAIKHNYSKKQSAYLNIGAEHRFRAVFRSTTNQARKAEYDTALYFYNESLKVDPNNAKALREKQEVLENLKVLGN
jgi:tetratricopeptide (TPR) repeat protein